MPPEPQMIEVNADDLRVVLHPTGMVEVPTFDTPAEVDSYDKAVERLRAALPWQPSREARTVLSGHLSGHRPFDHAEKILVKLHESGWELRRLDAPAPIPAEAQAVIDAALTWDAWMRGVHITDHGESTVTPLRDAVRAYREVQDRGR